MSDACEVFGFSLDLVSNALPLSPYKTRNFLAMKYDHLLIGYTSTQSLDQVTVLVTKVFQGHKRISIARSSRNLNEWSLPGSVAVMHDVAYSEGDETTCQPTQLFISVGRHGKYCK